LNYLDISIHKTQNNIKTSIYRKPTFIDTIIPYTTSHPTQQKYAAIRFLYNKLNTYQLHNEEYHQEENIIHNILYNNSFPIHPQKPHNLKQNRKQNSPTLKHKWATFIYIGKETTYITNIFKHSDIRIAYRTNNTIQNFLTHKAHYFDKFSSQGTSVAHWLRWCAANQKVAGSIPAGVIGILRTVRTGKLWRRIESYHAYVPSSKRTLGNAHGSLLVTD